MKTQCLDSFNSLDPEQKAAISGIEPESFDCSLPWFVNLSEHALEASEQLKLVLVQDESSGLLALPMKYQHSPAFKPKEWRSLTNFYSALFAPIANRQGLDKLLANAIRCIRQSPLPWDVIHFSPLAVESDFYRLLYEALRSEGFWVFQHYCFGNWYLNVQGRSYADYFEGLSSRLKNTVKRKRKQFLAMPGARLELITGGDKLTTAIADYTRVYNASWKVQEPYPDFMPGLIQLCADHGWLRLGIAYLDNTPIAVQVWIVAYGTAAIYKLAYDEQYATLSAGSVLTAYLMESVIDQDKVSSVDYLIGDDAYKKDWMSHRRERWGIIAYNPRTLLGLFGAARQTLGEWRRFCLSRWQKPSARPFT